MACLKPAVELFVQQLPWPTTLGLARAGDSEKLLPTDHSTAVTFVIPPSHKQSPGGRTGLPAV